MKAGAPLALGRSLVVTIDLAITVENVDAARSRIRNEVERAGGYVADASTDGSGDGRKAHLTLRVPASSTSSVRTALDAVGIVDSDVEKVQDVTEERVDVEARLQNARVQEKRVIEIMSQKTGSIAEVLSAETELARIRETIERMDVQKRAMDSRVDLATLHVALETRNSKRGRHAGTTAKGGLGNPGRQHLVFRAGRAACGVRRRCVRPDGARGDRAVALATRRPDLRRLDRAPESQSKAAPEAAGLTLRGRGCAA